MIKCQIKKAEKIMKFKSYIVQCYHATRSQQFQTHLIVTVVVHFVGINKCKIKCASFAFI